MRKTQSILTCIIVLAAAFAAMAGVSVFGADAHAGWLWHALLLGSVAVLIGALLMSAVNFLSGAAR